MKLYRVFLVISLLVFTLLFAQPSWAKDKPEYASNPDYIELTQTLNNLVQARDTQQLPEGVTAEQAQQQINNLLFQKYIMETGEETSVCTNQTGQILAVYGSNSEEEEEEDAVAPTAPTSTLYLLADGQTTDEDWNCEGVYVPSNVKVAGLNLGSAAAIKVLTGTELVVTTNPVTGALELNVPPAKVFAPGETNWAIPDLTQEALAIQIPTAPIND